jgi:dTDP-4-amino-4,6-dideoxygalactose transaminase
MRVPFADLAAQEASIADEVLRAVEGVAREGWFVLGPRVEAFERWLASACGVAHAVGVASGTDAIELGLRAVGVGPGDAVITPAVSFVAAAEATARLGAEPFFCDVDEHTMNASERTVGDAIDRARRRRVRVRAIIPVDLFGLCAPGASLRALAASTEAALLEDAAQALGARNDGGQPAGSAGDAAAFSFFPTKNLGAWGDGGALVTCSDEVAARVRRLRVHGACAPHVHDEVGYNSRLDAVQAAVLLTKASHLDRWQRARTAIASRYRAELGALPLHLPHEPEPPAVHGWHAFVVRTERRDALAHFLRERGVEARIYYPKPLHEQACFASLEKARLPVAEKVCGSALALPIFPSMRHDAQSFVIDQVTAFFAAKS